MEPTDAWHLDHPTLARQLHTARLGCAYYPGQTTVTGGQVIPINRACRTEFTVSPAGVITNWRWEGNACVAGPPK